MPAHDDVHLCLVKHVSHVQASGHIRWWQQQRENRARLALGRSGNREELLPDPVIRPVLLNRTGLVRFGQFVGHLPIDIQRYEWPIQRKLWHEKAAVGTVAPRLKGETLILQAREKEGQTRPGG